MIRKCARCDGVASERRHDHTRGTLITRPSTRCATISSLVTRTSRIRGSLLTTVLMPCLQNHASLFFDKVADHVQLSCPEAVVPRERHRLQPELTRPSLALSVNVRGLSA